LSSGAITIRRKATHDSQAAASYYSHAVTERHFGLGRRREVDVRVEFYPSGVRVRRRGVRADTTVEIPEPTSDKE
jgi:hypothetical protein